MINAGEIPVWAAIVISFFLLGGAFLTLVGCIGLVRFKSFYERVHAPTLGSSFGAGGILIASIIFFSILQSKPILHEVVITVFVVVTTPVTLMLLSRAVIHRDRTQDSKELPSSSDPL
ncbi:MULTISPECIES: monovalent cation/H(+) antiporter subunit G [Brucella/Ochrobactrum group]|jgi:multicomponent K+:H+ antiporter subunit G|uniref:Monovalent cation/H(+) antiporter subunit G n=1 Tax=Brucella pseudintermedia TaxID=370111 RepID=A0ABY5UHQ9_9HYPH|nr:MULTISPECIES: monovalent cation/H(+) antiporter subunit G [Brucella/Ochrobactrum group]KAB2679947.1 cation:proton antiporter [Brucella pseudintermedia]MCO7727465.1 monovalent cation/H(+) antiporter subunit G [Brucella intermedia]NKE74899.1 cation:proton antiporter [Ochrobactrum sp. MC-1LL]TWH03292.1 multisubunit potassium/proton antiporter PhaG subunit [Ochrobactrum sp. J50]UWL62386.1 monovalent cation/H(+) antiporter subunit G [Brucella pseudintermedia]